MSLKKEERQLLSQLKKKIAKAENAASEPVIKNYVFRITAAHVVRKEVVAATSKPEAEEVMFQRYGDLPYELIEIIPK